MNKTRFVVQSAVIAAMYATLTILQSFFFVRAGFGDFIIQGGLVALGELAVLFVLGLPLSRLIEHTGLDNKLLSPVSKK